MAWSRKSLLAAGRVGRWLMVSAWPEPPSAKLAEQSAGACDGQEELALCTSDTPNPIDGKYL